MSRIGKRPVTIPSGVSAEIADGVLTVKGPKGTLTLSLREEIARAGGRVSFWSQAASSRHDKAISVKRFTASPCCG